MTSMTSLIADANKPIVKRKAELGPRARNLRAKRIRRLTGLRDRVIPSIDIKRLNFERFVCGTFMCLGGWAATDKWFKAAGLYLDTTRNTVIFTYDNGKFTQHAFGFIAMAKFFMITTEEAWILFAGYVPPSDLSTEQILTENRIELLRRVDMITDLIKKYGSKS